LKLLDPNCDMQGLKVLVTAGPTVERIDPVRYLTNDSSGKMGYALAVAAKERGATVTLLSGPVSLEPPQGITVVPITSTQNLYDEMMLRCQEQQVIIQAAAPADYRVEQIADQKIKKQAGEPLLLQLVENPDIAKAVGAQKQAGQLLVGFAAETENVLANAQKKLLSKGLDMIVANDVTMEGAGFGSDTNVVTLITANYVKPLEKASKREIAEQIWNHVVEMRNLTKA
ncbi:MAG: bifunctional phosphopantothenoylcysteine decarboxylase/phosphopantothenate--cysteine ligase CoaBC, partial [Clostridia bacterium]